MTIQFKGSHEVLWRKKSHQSQNLFFIQYGCLCFLPYTWVDTHCEKNPDWITTQSVK